jgi:hypothetical protein
MEMEIDSYRGLPGLNQSILKKILTSPLEFKKAKEKQETAVQSTEDHFLFGTLVDLMLTSTKQDFDNRYVVVPDETKCSDAVKGIVEEVANNVFQTETIDCPLESYREDILAACDFSNYQANWKDDTRVDKIIKEGAEYFELLKSITGKTPVAHSEYSKAVNCVAALKADAFTKPYVDKKFYTNQKIAGVQILDKVIIAFNHNGVLIKGELDRVIVNPVTKEIIPIDFKTTSKSINGFKYEFWKYRYDFQAAVYYKGILESPQFKEYFDQGYVLKNFLYIVVEKDLTNVPMCFEISQDVLNIGFSGGVYEDREYLGFEQALSMYIYADVNGEWTYSKEYIENGGKTVI